MNNEEKFLLVPEEFLDVAYVLLNGAEKYGMDSWLSEHPAKFSLRANHESMCRHLAQSHCGITEDTESSLHPLLHLSCRALMEYTRYKKGIVELPHKLEKVYTIE